jgi:3-oxoisoapionate decarboxylase
MAIRLGYDTYTIRALKWDAFQHLEYVEQQKLDAVQFSSLNDFGSLEPAYLAKVKQRAEELGVRLDGGTGCVCELSKSWDPSRGTPRAVLEQGLEVAHAIGATVMRCYMGSQLDRYGDKPLEQLIEATVRNFKAVRTKAVDLNVKVAIENHKDMQSWQVKTLIEEAGKDYVGSNLDLGNPCNVMEDPLTALETLGPYAVTTHIRDSAVYEVPRGAAVQWTALGDGSVNFKKVVKRYEEICPQASFQLEIITGRPPETLPYLEAAFWKTYQGMPARDFAAFVALAKSGQPFSGRMVIEDVEGKAPSGPFKPALEYQQRYDLERSLQYAKEVLGVGMRS